MSVQDAKTVSAQDSRYPAMSALYAHFALLSFQDSLHQIGILRGAKPSQQSRGYIKQNLTFEGSQELKGRSEKFISY
jgi:hypothetical protein